MNEFNTYEFVVAQKHEGKVQLFRILAVVSYVLFFCVVAAALILLHFPWMVAVLPIFEWILIFFTWRYRSVEFEYSMTSGNITFSYIRWTFPQNRFGNCHQAFSGNSPAGRCGAVQIGGTRHSKGVPFYLLGRCTGYLLCSVGGGRRVVGRPV